LQVIPYISSVLQRYTMNNELLEGLSTLPEKFSCSSCRGRVQTAERIVILDSISNDLPGNSPAQNSCRKFRHPGFVGYYPLQVLRHISASY
jgi:hypothetical protein